MSAAFWGCYVILFILSTYGFMAIVLSRKSKLPEWIVLLYLIAGLLTAGTIYIYKEIKPFDREQITFGIIKEEVKIRTFRGSWITSRYSYEVNGKEYEGGVHKDNTYMWRYNVGDTIDITYNLDDPSVSCATYKQYWYINSDKEKYLNKIKEGVGRRTFH